MTEALGEPAEPAAVRAVHPFAHAGSIAAHAANQLSIQAMALVSLSGLVYGAFSLLYLVFALGFSVSLSVVGEAVARGARRGLPDPGWARASSVLLRLAAFFGLVALGVGLAVAPLRAVAALGAAGVAVATLRIGIRYEMVRGGSLARAALADGCSFAVVLLGWAVVRGDGLPAVLGTWLVAGAAGTAASWLPHLGGSRAVRGWWQERRRDIVPLLRESLLLDIGNVATPYALAPILGLAPFATYRAVSNVAAPVRLVITPLRPLLATMSLVRARSSRTVATGTAAAVLVGGLTWLALVGVGRWDVDLGTLSTVAEYALPTALFTAGSLLVLLVYVVARVQATPGRLMRARVVQTVLVTVAPMAGAALGGLGPAIWAATLATLASVPVWWWVLPTREPEPAGRR